MYSVFYFYDHIFRTSFFFCSKFLLCVASSFYIYIFSIFLSSGCAGSLSLCTGAFSSCGEPGLLFLVVLRFLTAVASLVERGLLGTPAAVVVARRLSSYGMWAPEGMLSSFGPWALVAPRRVESCRTPGSPASADGLSPTVPLRESCMKGHADCPLRKAPEKSRDRHPPISSPLPGRLMDAKVPRLWPIKKSRHGTKSQSAP